MNEGKEKTFFKEVNKPISVMLTTSKSLVGFFLECGY